MPTGRPDSTHFVAERLIQDAMKAGEFDDLQGAGRPIRGAGTKDDAGWWIRSWVERNRGDDQESSNRE